jgi:hypothetical protein
MKPKPSIRRDGWTAERSVAGAAASAGMSREGAYRLRNRMEGSLFALLWDRALTPEPSRCEVHTGTLSDGRIARLVGNHFRRESGDFSTSARREPDRTPGDRTVRL